jgi:ribA/ribD-fused uncharacterized protein
MIVSEVANIPKTFRGYRGKYEKFTYFWKRSAFSQWYRKAPFFASETVDGKMQKVFYSCAEQYMMAHKARFFNDEETLAKIMATEDPEVQKALGREVKNFDKAAWDEIALSIVQQANRYKFYQNPDILAELMATKGTLLVEASPHDRIWGIGIDEQNAAAGQPWDGENKLGTALTWVREGLELKEMYEKPISEWPKLPNSDKKEYPKPSYTADNIVLSYPEQPDLSPCDVVLPKAIPEILLIRRGNDPFKGKWAISGGFVEQGETGMQAARREGKEELGIDLPGTPKFIGIYDDPNRDPRGWVIAGAWLWFISPELKLLVNAGDDAAEAKWFPFNQLPELAFDHAKILADVAKGFI